MKVCNLCTFIRVNKLTWHNCMIPSDEIWLKIGGDKGGSSFKMSIQLVKVIPTVVLEKGECICDC